MSANKRGILVKIFDSPLKPPNLEGAKIKKGKGRGGNILGLLPSNIFNHARGGTHFPSPSLPFPQTKQAVWFEGRGGKGREGREWKGDEGFNITLFGLIIIKEGNGREGESLMIICLVKEGREG